MITIDPYIGQWQSIFAKNPQLSDIKPSAWAEKNIIIPGGKGRLSYDFNPYCREIIDTLDPNHPARKIAVMKGSQITFSSGVIMPALGYIMAENPGNTYLSVGKPNLIKPAGEKLDLMIQGAKLQDLVAKYTVNRAKNNKSGDTDEMKYFPGGYARLTCITDSKDVAQVDLDNIFLDDFDSMKNKTKDGGNLLDLLQMRAASNANTYKLMMISTPLLRGLSNIEPAFNNGDRRYYFIHCPCCHEHIIIKKSVAEGEVINPLIDNEIAKGNGGMYYEVNNHGQLIEKSVGCICYKCAGFFTDKNKQKLIREADWIPTAMPITKDYYSYHISSLYAPVGMFNWAYYMGKEVEANPQGLPKDEYKSQVLQNTCYGLTFEPSGEAPKATSIQRNCRNYKPGEIPEQQSIRDGNGPIIMLTLAADMNGIQDKDSPVSTHDVRLDYEVKAWSAEGPSYSILHGSIGTFQRGIGKDTSDRKRWTYEDNKENSVWPEFEKAISQIFHTDSPSADSPTGFRRMRVELAGLDCGHFTSYAYAFLDKTNLPVVGIKGEKEQKYIPQGVDAAIFRAGTERKQDYILQVGLIKDKLSENMGLNWDRGHEPQPTNFMNFPEPNDGLYLLDNYFSHFESEKKQLLTNKDGSTSYRWEKINGTVQNHMWDCAVYNIALRDIIVSVYANLLPGKPKGLQWRDYVNHVLGA